MSDKQQALALLKKEFRCWQDLLSTLSEAQITAPDLPANLSIKDVVAHLMAWQQVSIARLEAARLGTEPVFPDWLASEDPESEEHRDAFNARIYALYHQQPWPWVYQAWRDGFGTFLRLAEQIPEQDFLDAAKYPWLKGYPLLAVLQGSYEHHHDDHLEPLLAWLRQRGKIGA
jgi:hypothetical protein